MDHRKDQVDPQYGQQRRKSYHTSSFYHKLPEDSSPRTPQYLAGPHFTPPPYTLRIRQVDKIETGDQYKKKSYNSQRNQQGSLHRSPVIPIKMHILQGLKKKSI